MDDTAYNPANSYVNTYVPPSEGAAPVSQSPSRASYEPDNAQKAQAQTTSPLDQPPSAFQTPASTSQGVVDRVVAIPITPPAAPPTTSTVTPAPTPVAANSPEPTEASATQPQATANVTTTAQGSQMLENQNIFDLLGVDQASEAEKETFLDELQQVIWEDFLDNDVELLLTDSELQELHVIQAKSYPDDLAKQETIVSFLEKLIPDLEEIMLEKALELKRDMVMERIAGMKEYFAGQADKLATISQAEQLITSQQWRSAAELLNRTAQT